MSRATRKSIKATPICHHYNKLLARQTYRKTDKYRKNGDISLIDHLLSIAKKDTHQPKAQFEMINTWDDG